MLAAGAGSPAATLMLPGLGLPRGCQTGSGVGGGWSGCGLRGVAGGASLLGSLGDVIDLSPVLRRLTVGVPARSRPRCRESV